MKTALRVSLPVLFSILAFGASAPLAFAANATADDFFAGAITAENVGSALANGPETINTGATQSAVTGGVITVSGAIRAKNSNSDSSTQGPAIAQYLLIPTGSTRVEESTGATSLGFAELNTDPNNTDRGWFDLTKSVFRMGVYLYSNNALRTGDIPLRFVFKNDAGTVLKDVNYTLRFETTAEPVFIDKNNDGKFNSGEPSFNTIQAAITAASAGDTINVAAGEYVESGQIVINKNLNIVGAGKLSTIIKPAESTASSVTTNDLSGWIVVKPGYTFNLSKVTLDGFGKNIAQAIIHHGNGTIDDCSIKNIKFDSQSGVGIRIQSAEIVDVLNSDFSEIGRNGILFKGAATSLIDHNTYTGKGPGSWYDYGIEVQYGANVTITNNTISNNLGAFGGYGSSGVTVWGDPGDTVTFSGNTFTNNTAGIAVAIDEVSEPTFPLVGIGTGNVFNGNDVGIDIQNVGGTGGSPTVTVTGSTFSGNVKNISVEPGILADHLTFPDNTGVVIQIVPTDGTATLGSDTSEVVITDPGQPLTVTVPSDVTNPTINFDALVTNGTGTLPELTVNSENSNVPDIAIPNDTIVTSADTSWDGTINLPTVVTTGVAPTPDSGNDANVVGSIEVGFDDIHLTFSKAVRLAFAGQAGNLIGWSQGGVFHAITAACEVTGGDVQASQDTDLPANSECKMNVGSDLVVYTKHFSTFTTYTQTAVVVPPSSSHGGGNACGLGFTFNPSTLGCDRATPAVPANVTTPDGCAPGNKFSTTTGRNCNAATPATGQGRVLGASTFNFTRNLGVGLSGEDVTALQQILIDAGLLKINAPTGNFGQLTKAAVQAFQKSHGIEQVGNVGPLTRAELNKGSASSGVTVDQMNSILTVLQSFDVDQAVIDKVRAALLK